MQSYKNYSPPVIKKENREMRRMCVGAAIPEYPLNPVSSD